MTAWACRCTNSSNRASSPDARWRRRITTSSEPSRNRRGYFGPAPVGHNEKKSPGIRNFLAIGSVYLSGFGPARSYEDAVEPQLKNPGREAVNHTMNQISNQTVPAKARPTGTGRKPRRSGTARMAGLAVAAMVAVPLSACGGGDEAIAASGAWARTSPMSATTGAVYMELTSSEDDVLVAASVPANIAPTVEIHEIVMMDSSDSEMDGMHDTDMEDTEDMDGMDDMAEGEEESAESAEGDMMGAMTMREMDGGLTLPADEAVTLAPGGYHIMLLNLPAPLETGDTFDVTLEFESGESLVVPVEVREEAP